MLTPYPEKSPWFCSLGGIYLLGIVMAQRIDFLESFRFYRCLCKYSASDARKSRFMFGGGERESEMVSWVVGGMAAS